jgi:hypothetical protein
MPIVLRRLLLAITRLQIDCFVLLQENSRAKFKFVSTLQRRCFRNPIRRSLSTEFLFATENFNEEAFFINVKGELHEHI